MSMKLNIDKIFKRLSLKDKNYGKTTIKESK